MSQVKVDKNKELKKNRKKIVKRRKIGHIAGWFAGILVIVAAIGWLGYSSYGKYQEAHADDPLPEYDLNISAVTDYLSTIDTDDD